MMVLIFYKAYGFKIITYKDFMKEEKQDNFTGVKWYTNGVEVASCTYDGLLIQKNYRRKTSWNTWWSRKEMVKKLY